MVTLLKHVMLLQRNVPRAAKYYSEGVGLKLSVLTESWAELDAGGTTIALKQCDGCFDPLSPVTWTRYCREAYMTTGYSPFLVFQVSELQDTIQRILPMGASMDGPIRFVAAGRVAAVRNPDGHMMTLFEPSDPL